MIKIDSHVVNAYTTLINGNDGENQLAITMTYRQDGKAAISITAASVDAECRVLVNNELVSYKNGEHEAFVTNQITNWTTFGIPPTAEEQDTEKQKIEVIVGDIFNT